MAIVEPRTSPHIQKGSIILSVVLLNILVRFYAATILFSFKKKKTRTGTIASKITGFRPEETKEEFKNEVQKELGRELRPYRLTRAANSIRRAQIYIENILDNKFMLDASHGINHIKHNLEYGYQLMNLIGRKRRRRQRSQ